MQSYLLEHQPEDAVPVWAVVESRYSLWLEGQQEPVRRWLMNTGYRAKPGSVCLLPGDDGKLNGVVCGVSSPEDIWALGDLPKVLPKGVYYIDGDWSAKIIEGWALGWALGAYQFTRYKQAQPHGARLAIAAGCDPKRLNDQIQAVGLVRDLINTPAEDMMPEQLADALTSLAQEFGAQLTQVVGDGLREQNYPLIHAVGRASAHPPRLLDLRWGTEKHPRVTLIGKGVCFDSGGLNLKPGNSMRLMKKDMGGAAHVMGLARMIMAAGLPVRLRVLVAAVENAVAGNALRPGDVIRSRKGLTVEIEDTDAEGRLILCDALAAGGTEKPDLMLDFATLTGAARVALGTEIPAMFSNSDGWANELLAAADRERDSLWRLPLHQPYRELLDSRIADIANASNTPFAGAITAALFLKEFVPPGTNWVHFDVMAWNNRARPGRPEGGEAMGIRAVFEGLRRRFGANV